ncbi:hypothetical protein LCGC14_2223050 [marine sediment metagenome]|uniref:Uncharacterized protein n=1 Tax=marine sediment metagenome TaxID=412755 RepID=A0A0F9DXW7_9ZZZZ
MKGLDKKHKQIKADVELNYLKIKDAEGWLEELRAECEHPEVENMDYMWAPGHISNAPVCVVCGEVIPDWATRTPWPDE